MRVKFLKRCRIRADTFVMAEKCNFGLQNDSTEILNEKICFYARNGHENAHRKKKSCESFPFYTYDDHARLINGTGGGSINKPRVVASLGFSETKLKKS